MLPLGDILGIFLIFGESRLVLFGSVAHWHAFIGLIGHVGVVLSEVLAVISVLTVGDMGIVIRVDSAGTSSSVLLLRVVIVVILELLSVLGASMLIVSLPLRVLRKAVLGSVVMVEAARLLIRLVMLVSGSTIIMVLMEIFMSGSSMVSVRVV